LYSGRHKINLKKIDFQQITGYLATLIILVSLFFIGISFTGRAVTITGQVNITIDSTATIHFAIDSINFGSGQVSAGNSSATLDSLGNIINGNWTPISEGFKLENTGNVNVSLNLRTGKTASEFLGGTNASYQYNITESEPGSCLPGPINLGEWYDVNTTGVGTEICSLFPFNAPNDEINIDVKLVIPSDARAGIQSDSFIATATATI
jgi:hypothetical protein